MGNTEYNKEAIITKKPDIEDNMTKIIFPFEEIDQHISKVSKSICKIEIETQEGIKKGTGFLMKFRTSFKMFYCLISNAHVLTKNIIKKIKI